MAQRLIWILWPGFVLAIPAAASQVDEAWAFIRWIASKAANVTGAGGVRDRVMEGSTGCRNAAILLQVAEIGQVSNHQLSWWYGGEPLKAV